MRSVKKMFYKEFSESKKIHHNAKLGGREGIVV